MASYLMWKKETVAGVWSDYVNEIPLECSQMAANYHQKTTHVFRVAKVIAIVQRFVRDRRSTRTRTVAKDVIDFLDN